MKVITGYLPGYCFERYILTGGNNELQELRSIVNGSVHNLIEYAFDFAASTNMFLGNRNPNLKKNEQEQGL